MGLTTPLYRFYEWYVARNIKKDIMPHHIAVIMDGNRRYSKVQDNMPVIKGHELGVGTLESLLDWCIELDIKIVTAYAFSTENFNRSESEVKQLMELFKVNFKNIANNKKIHKNKVQVRAVGRLDLLPDDVIESIRIAEKSTEDYTNHVVNIAIGYNGRLEIIDAVKKIATDVKNGDLDPSDIDEEIINNNLYTAGLKDPNLIIRTSGEERLSGFMLWQSSYSELYFCDSLWPNLRKVDFLRAIRSYQQRERRFGV